MANHSGEVFILTTKFYKIKNETALFSHKKRNPEGKAYVQPKGTEVNDQEKKTKKQATHKIHSKKLHKNIGHPV